MSAENARVGADKFLLNFTVINEVDHLHYASSISKLGHALRGIAALVYAIASVERREKSVSLSLSGGTLLSHGAEKIVKRFDRLTLEAF